jgi:ABC-type sugar transport system ATPase subunit
VTTTRPVSAPGTGTGTGTGTGHGQGRAVTCDRVSKTYSGGTAALHDVSLDCPAGQITVLLGPSGCGKTTLLRCVSGLEEVTSGRILLGGLDVTHVDAGRRDVAMVFQNYGLYPNKTVYKNIEFPLKMTRVSRDERRARVSEAARLLRIDTLLDRRPAQLSGGQRQRVGIGRAVVRRPSVLLMDEPLSNLDAALRVEMRAELARLQRELGMTTIYVTHDQAEALALADLLVVMETGRIQQAATAEAVYNQPATTFVASFLGAMNLIGGEVHGGKLRPSGRTSPVPLTEPPPDGPVTVGIRPEDIRLGPAPASALSLSGRTVFTELLGRERLVHFEAGRDIMRARIHADIAVPASFAAHVPVTDIHIFGQDGRRAAR